MKKSTPSAKPVERLFPFALRARILIVGRDTLLRNKSRLHFILITHDLSDQSRKEILSDFGHYPVVQRYTMAELEGFFQLKGTKVLGFAKSGLAQSIYAEMKEHRLNKPAAGECQQSRLGAGEAPETDYPPANTGRKPA